MTVIVLNFLNSLTERIALLGHFITVECRQSAKLNYTGELHGVHKIDKAVSSGLMCCIKLVFDLILVDGATLIIMSVTIFISS